MRLLLSCTLLMTLLCLSSLTAHAQADAPLPPTTMLVIGGEPISTTTAKAVAHADLDQDGDVDAFVMEWDHNKIWFNQGDDHYLLDDQRFGAMGQNAVALGDLDHDGDIDAFIAKQAPVAGRPNEVWLNDGTGHFTDSRQRLSGDDFSAHVDVQLGDFEQDGDLDAFVAANGELCGVSRLWLNDGNGHFAEATQNWPGCADRVALGDLNHDQQLDLVFNHQHGLAGLTVWLSQGNLTWVEAQVIPDGYDTDALTTGDLDNDGDLDLFTTGNLTKERVPTTLRFNKLWLNDGSGKLLDSGQWLLHFPTDSNLFTLDAALTLADVDQDGDLDGITVTHFALVSPQLSLGENILIVHFNDGAGHFTQSRLRTLLPSTPTNLPPHTITLAAVTQQLYLPLIQKP